MAAAIYAAQPIECSGEAIDGHQVTPGGALSWQQVVEMDQEGPYLMAARAALAELERRQTESMSPRSSA